MPKKTIQKFRLEKVGIQAVCRKNMIRIIQTEITTLYTYL